MAKCRSSATSTRRPRGVVVSRTSRSECGQDEVSSKRADDQVLGAACASSQHGPARSNTPQTHPKNTPRTIVVEPAAC